MPNKPDATLISLVVGMFLSLLVCIGLLGFMGLRSNTQEYRFDIMREDYTRRIEMQSRDYETRYNRLQEQMSTLQFTTDKRQHLLEEQLLMYRNENKH